MRCPRLRPPRAGADRLPDPHGHDDRAVPARRRRRHHRAPGGRGHGPLPQADDRSSRTRPAPAAASACSTSRARSPTATRCCSRSRRSPSSPRPTRSSAAAPMYQLGQLVPIARFTADPTVLVVRADSPWKSVQDMLEAAKKAPGTIPYGSSGNYGTMHVPMEMLTGAAGAKHAARALHRRRSRGRRPPRRQRGCALHRTLDDHGLPEGAASCACSRAGAKPATPPFPTCPPSRSWATTRSSRNGRASSCPPARRSP